MFSFLGDRKSNRNESNYDDMSDYYTSNIDDYVDDYDMDNSNLISSGLLGYKGQGGGQINLEIFFEQRVIHKDFYNDFDDDCDEDNLE
jgi:hypothetical protein